MILSRVLRYHISIVDSGEVPWTWVPIFGSNLEILLQRDHAHSLYNPIADYGAPLSSIGTLCLATDNFDGVRG